VRSHNASKVVSDVAFCMHVSNSILFGVALKTSCNAVEMSHVATLEKDKSLDIFIFPTNSGLKYSYDILILEYSNHKQGILLQLFVTDSSQPSILLHTFLCLL
jgi:hypothetical protein